MRFPIKSKGHIAKYHLSQTTLNTVPEWRIFLQCWSEEWLTTNERFSPTVRRNKWLGYRAATKKQVNDLETRLGYRLPPSFRSFLLTTNGWRRTSNFIRRIRPITKIEWLEVDDPSFLDVWDQFDDECFGKHGGLSQREYFSYTKHSRIAFDKEHFRTSLLISDPVPGDSAMYLLNPMVVAENGEWEAWFSAHWLPGVVRFPSFAYIMLAQYGSFRSLNLNDKACINIEGPFKGVYAPDKPRCQAERIGPGKPRPRRLTVEELVQRLNDLSAKVRKDAARKLLREYKPHDPKDERPLLVKPLSRILHSNLETDVRCAAACTLGSYGNADAIKPLVLALKDQQVASCAVGSLYYLSHYYKSSRIPNGLCAYLSTPQDRSPTMEAIHILEDYRDPRLEAISLRILDSDVDKQLRFTAAFALARVSKRAFDEFITRLTHNNPEIREVAAAAIRETNDKHAIAGLKRALNDKDSHVRMQAEMSLRFLRKN